MNIWVPSTNVCSRPKFKHLVQIAVSLCKTIPIYYPQFHLLWFCLTVFVQYLTEGLLKVLTHHCLLSSICWVRDSKMSKGFVKHDISFLNPYCLDPILFVLSNNAICILIYTVCTIYLFKYKDALFCLPREIPMLAKAHIHWALHCSLNMLCLSSTHSLIICSRHIPL